MKLNARSTKQIALLVVAWLAVLLIIGALEYWVVNPEGEESGGGQFLDLLSIVTALLGVFTIPPGSVWICRRNGAKWRNSFAAGLGVMIGLVTGVVIMSLVLTQLKWGI